MADQVNTKAVAGRRQLHFDTIDEALADAEQLAHGPYAQLGDWSLGEMCEHLARSLDSATDDNQFQPGLLLRLIGPMFRKRMISSTTPAGFRMPEQMKPIFMPATGTTTNAGLAQLRTAVERFKSADLPARSPTFGKMSREDWHQFHCRHAEMHLSFLVPQAA